MRFHSFLVGGLAMLASTLSAADALPASAELAKLLAPFLAKPIPSIESLVGVAMPAPSPLMVVASLGDDASQPDQDRGYAVGFTLNELLFDADAKLDVVAPWLYQYDTRMKGAPRGLNRDSAANAYRAAMRDHASWCTHGRVSGVKPVQVEFVVDACAPGISVHRRRWTVRSDSEWPGVLAEMCEFAIASARGELEPKALTSCGRAREIRPASLLAMARFGGPKENRAWKVLETLHAEDPKFAPTTIEYLWRVPYREADRSQFGERILAIAKEAPQSSAVQLLAYSRLARNIGWNLKYQPYPKMIPWVREHPNLYEGWMALASGLAGGTPEDWPADKPAPSTQDDGIFSLFSKKRNNPPNEATHTMSLALSLAMYQRWPDAYRTRWQMGYALQRYGWMLRGQNFWEDVPAIGKRGFPVFIDWAERFYESTLAMNPDADEAWIGLMISTKLNHGDWLDVFDRAVEANPRDSGLYETAMSYAIDRWGENLQTRLRIERAALEKNPEAAWAKTLRQRWEAFGKPEK